MNSAENTPVRTDVRKLEKRRLRENIKATLAQFTFSQLVDKFILKLFELRPAEIHQKLNELRLQHSKDSVSNLLLIRSKDFSIEELEEVYHSLLLYRIAFFSKSKTWVPVNLLEPANDLQCSADKKVIRRNILQAFRTKGLNAIVKVITYEELIWVMIIEKKLVRRRGLKLQPAKFLCYEVGTPYIFLATKVSDVIMGCLLRAMQYKKHKIQNLEGRDVKSLITVLKHKAMNGSKSSVVPYIPAEATIGNRFIDLSKKKSRESYANRVFDSKDSINLETFNVHADAEWRDSELVPEMKGEPFTVSLTLKSKNLIGMIKNMVTTDMVATPLPDYLQAIMRSGKNKIVMRAK